MSSINGNYERGVPITCSLFIYVCLVLNQQIDHIQILYLVVNSIVKCRSLVPISMIHPSVF